MSDIRCVEAWLSAITARLAGKVERPRREAELLLMAHLQRDQLWLITHPDAEVPNTKRLLAWSERRVNHEPLEYITNRVSFYSQYFYSAPGALIPRPETELLIDHLLMHTRRDTTQCIVEVGVGSGVISIVLAQQLPHARIIAVDLSEEALAVAAYNIERFGLEGRIELRQSDALNAVLEPIDLLVSNPPYIANKTTLEPNLDYEPSMALYGGDQGDELIVRLLCDVKERNIGCFACEMGYDQKARIAMHAQTLGLETPQFYKDYAGFDRGFILQHKGNS